MANHSCWRMGSASGDAVSVGMGRGGLRWEVIFVVSVVYTGDFWGGVGEGLMAEGWPLWFPTHREIELRDEWGTVLFSWSEDVLSEPDGAALLDILGECG